ncbi:helix-turn-helix transcriptional regulator [Streptomyces sp. 5-10]|uniref:helix-turn-helix domain-containing protein n=1 Tax=Streptomyces sp. 5-10 TaxID=878925 RepID=UPI00168B2E29|nr:helix-turn-helix transcriptional regulator [Streptomyces sp. 5-10]MBD3004534.1 helix-turn-helix domain-containing protein [Streptomyces sp. 5-10]
MTYQGKPTIRKQIVGRYLHRLREAAGLSMDDVAKEFGVSRAAAYRHETGNTAVDVAAAEKYMRLYDVQDEAVARRIIDLARTSRKKGWWEGYRGTADLAQIEIADLEDLATSISNYEPMVIPGLVQTKAYSEALILGADDQTFPYKVIPRKSLEIRNQRKAVLTKKDRPDLRFVFSEIAFKAPVASEEVMTDQAKHLVHLIRDKGVSVQILRHTPGEGMATPDRPLLLVTAGGEDAESIVYLDNLFGGSAVDDQQVARRAAELFVHLQHRALSPEETARYLERVHQR